LMIIGGGLMIAFGIGNGGVAIGLSNLWAHGGFMPNGINGVIAALPIVMFAYLGVEMLGLTAGEARNPEKSLTKAVNSVFWRVLIFYIGALAVLLSLYPWEKVVTGGSPFVLIFHALSSNLVANVLNVVVLTAALSVYNSGVYSNSRMLFGLAQQGNAPKVLCSVNKRGIPLAALGASALATGVCVLVNYFMPGKAFEVLMGLVVSALIINWAMITLIHLKFRQAKRAAREETSFRSLGYPFTNYLCLAFMAGILVVMYLTPDLRLSVYLIPV
ncbi:amino acid permease, partial [Ralstonia pickettii]|nr:amino acid permease [Ralstonia pickettii]